MNDADDVHCHCQWRPKMHISDLAANKFWWQVVSISVWWMDRDGNVTRCITNRYRWERQN